MIGVPETPGTGVMEGEGGRRLGLRSGDWQVT